jgi:RNA polymerase sigma-70 factor (family 1)
MQFEESDKIIAHGLKEGNVMSFDIIFKKYNKKIYFFALSYLKNKEEAEDVVQEVFMNLWKFREQINEYYVFSSYLFKITYNATIKKFRKQSSNKRQVQEMLKYISLEDNSTNIDVEYNSLVEHFNKIIENLPSRQKEIFIKSCDEQLNSKEIADQLKISRKTVENYLSITKSYLKSRLKGTGLLSVLFTYLFI